MKGQNTGSIEVKMVCEENGDGKEEYFEGLLQGDSQWAGEPQQEESEEQSDVYSGGGGSSYWQNEW